MGTGHVMRCFALAQEWQQGGHRVQFVQAGTTPALTNRLSASGIDVRRIDAIPGSVEDATQTIAAAHEADARWIVADGYCFGAEWQKRIKSEGIKLLVLDDYGHADYYHADLILNQNLSASERLYEKRDPLSHLLLGTRYALLRREFQEWRGFRRENPTVARKILVTMGGCDSDNVTGKVLHALSKLPQMEVVVAVGGSNPNLEWLKSFARGRTPGVRLVVNADNMPELMAWADIAAAAAGSTSWELAFMGLPSLIFVVADNQVEAAQALDRNGAAINMGWHNRLAEQDLVDKLSEVIHSPVLRSTQSECGRSLVDGLGAERVVEELR